MRIVRGPRPLPVSIFAFVLLGLAAWNLAAALFDLPAQAETLRSLGLGLEWNRDWTIVASAAWFTIELIPITAVWLFASRFARAFITAMAGLKAVLILTNLPMLYALPGILLGQSIALVAVGLLFARDSNRWFAREEGDLATFD
jgi:hypothetical protein